VVSLVKNHFFHFYYGRFRLHVSFACGIIQRCSQTNFSNSIYTNLAELAPIFFSAYRTDETQVDESQDVMQDCENHAEEGN
jgi:hypothetical protein